MPSDRWEQTIAALCRHGYLESAAVTEAMRSVDRKAFVDTASDAAYRDRPLSIGHDQTISAPHMVAIMTEALDVTPDSTVLEVGTGSGYQAAILGELADQVYTVERIQALAEQARERLAAYDNVEVVHTDGYAGLPEEAPFDRIIVTAAPDKIPATLVTQLRDGGRMVVPVGNGRQRLKIFEKQESELEEVEDWGGVRFVPMQDGEA